MKDLLRASVVTKVVVVIFLLLTAWWTTLQLMNLPKESNYNQLFAAVYGLIALFGAIWGIGIAKKWGGMRSVLGRSILFFSIGLFFQEIGQLAYSYYIYFLNIDIPYPSIGDLFFYGTIPIYTIAVLDLAKASGVHVSLQSLANKIQAVLIPVVVLAFCYFFFLQGYEFDWSNPLVVILDLGVPLGQAIYISFAILTYTLSRGVLGGVMKSRVLLILLALVAQYVADWTFLYQASLEIWYAGGVNDYMYLCAYFLMTLALLNLNTQSIKKHLD